jgi:methylmalonyl-CoA/ethylmalonyl-CoA epimerase
MELPLKIEHLGIAVRDGEAAKQTFERLLGTSAYKEEIVESEGVKTIFFRVGESKIELLVATRPDSPIAKFIEKRGEGIHHVAFGVGDADRAIERLVNENFDAIHAQAKAGADGKNIAFIHPKSTHGVLVEICSDRV